jgi:hypothetical protein
MNARQAKKERRKQEQGALYGASRRERRQAEREQAGAPAPAVVG